MKPRNLAINQLQMKTNTETYSKYNTSTTPWTFPVTTSTTITSTSKPWRNDILTCAATLHGDKTTPMPFSFSKTDQVSMTGSYTQYKMTGTYGSLFTESTYVFTGPSGSGVGLVLSPPVNESYNNALAKLNEKLRGEVDLSIDLLQGGQVQRMVRASAKLVSYTKGFNRKTIANKWLEFTYGWKPLAQDLHDALEQVYSTANSSKRLSAKATVEDKRRTVVTEDIWIKTQMNEVSARTLISLDYTPANPSVDQASRLSSLNPVSIAWELVPYSFVVDWFYDIGGFLRATETYLIASAGTVSRAYSTTTTKNRSSATWVGRGKVAGGYSTSGSLSGYTEVKTLSRQLYSFWPLPRRPVFKADLGASRLLSAAALLSQFLSDQPEKRVPKKSITTLKWNSTRNKVVAHNSVPYVPFRKR